IRSDVTGEGRVVIIVYLIAPSDQLEPCTRHYVVAPNSQSKAIMFFSAMRLLTGLTSLACFCLRYSLRWHLRSSRLKRLSLALEPKTSLTLPPFIVIM